jgi:hypothetical protein
MTSERKIASNRTNSRSSSGPKTPRGKRVASKNALKHGLCGSEIVIAGEDPEAFQELKASLMDEWAPVGAMEIFLVGRLADLQWRLLRVPRLEAAILSASQNSQDGLKDGLTSNREAARIRAITQCHQDWKKVFNVPDDPEQMTPQELEEVKSHLRYLWLARIFDECKPPDPSKIGSALLADASNGDALGKLQRYDTTLMSNLARALSMLVTLQSGRKNSMVERQIEAA